jgi:hypothetical protein
MPPELEHHIHEILKHLKSQGPQDPAVSFIVNAAIGKLSHNKMIRFVDKYKTEED